MNTEQDALRLYADRMPLIEDYTKIFEINVHYYPLIKHHNNILLHTRSIVTFCHMIDPQQFGCMTQKSFRAAFPRWKVMWIKGFSISFRLISEELFKEIVNDY